MHAALVCPGLNDSNTNRQPWFYFNAIRETLCAFGNTLTVYTDGPYHPSADGVSVKNISPLRSFPQGCSQQLIQQLIKDKPDLIFWSTGITDFLSWRSVTSLSLPVILVITAPRPTCTELFSLGRELFEEARILRSLLLSPFLNDYLIAHLFTHPMVKGILFQSSWTKDRYCRFKVDRPVMVLPPPANRKVSELVTDSEFDISPSREPGLITYFGPPLKTRGVDLVVRAHGRLKELGRDSRLLVLSRLEHEALQRQHKKLITLIDDLRLGDSTEVISKYLDYATLVNYLKRSHVVCLPFRFTVSDAPLVIAETLALDLPLVTTLLSGAEDIIHDRKFLVPSNDLDRLVEALDHVLALPPQSSTQKSQLVDEALFRDRLGCFLTEAL